LRLTGTIEATHTDIKIRFPTVGGRLSIGQRNQLDACHHRRHGSGVLRERPEPSPRAFTRLERIEQVQDLQRPLLAIVEEQIAVAIAAEIGVKLLFR
jgi:hypothetical protein